MGEHVRIYEVGPRDGLQNEATSIGTRTKVRFIELLASAGLREIEATSFVSPKAIPQLADASELMAGLLIQPEVRLTALVPNEKGMARAEAAGVGAVAVFTAATDAFTKANIGMSIEE
jgi:hydroxymethylglutaryl-CoA lyase